LDNDSRKAQKQQIIMKKLPSILGGTLVLLSLVYIANYLWLERAKLLDWEFSILSLAFIVIAVFVYAAINLLLSSSWALLLNFFGPHPIDPKILRSIYATSQVAKYIPGNVAHVIGRHAMGRQLGISHTVLVTAAVYEILGLSTASIGIAVVGASAVSTEWPFLFSPTILSISFVVLLVMYCLGFLYYPRLTNIFSKSVVLQKKDYKKTVIVTLQTLLRYFVFFMASGCILLSVSLSLIGSIPSELIGLLLITFAVSWVVGFITPGAPSGIGVREAIIVYMLQSTMPPAVALMTAVIFRITTVLGDVLFLAVNHIYKVRK